MKKYEIVASVRKDAKSEARKVKFIIDVTDLTENDILEYALDTLVIRAQSQWRRLPNSPEVFEYKPGQRVKLSTFDQLIKAISMMTPEEKHKILDAIAK